MPKGKFAVLAMAACLSACATSGGIGKRERLVALPMNELPIPAGINPNDETRPYNLGPKDKISISVYGDDALGVPSIMVGGNGRIDLPAVGEVEVQGRSTSDVAREIELRLKGILKDPRVSVNVVEPASQFVTVDGAIGKPGLYPVMGRTTLQQVVASAGSMNEYSVLEKVVIMRRLDGKTMIALYNLKDIRQGTYKDPEVFAGDTVLVGSSEARRWFKDLLQGLPLVFLVADRTIR